MPWTWNYCRYCMNLQDGTFLQWPLGPRYRDNKVVLPLMKITWETWRHVSLTGNPNHKWSAWDINFDLWLNEGRGSTASESAAEQWIR
ncbi:MAG: hypothetical protein GY943_19390, partial [Chloroflexi bacterium]|nr:hypothetical protein [Chloroflexota bacterium]